MIENLQVLCIEVPRLLNHSDLKFEGAVGKTSVLTKNSGVTVLIIYGSTKQRISSFRRRTR